MLGGYREAKAKSLILLQAGNATINIMDYRAHQHKRLLFWIIPRLLFFAIIAIAILIARWTEYSSLVQSVIAYVAMDGIALALLLLCNTVDAISSLGEKFSVVWGAPYFLWISKYLGLTSFNRWESREVDLISRRKELSDYFRQREFTEDTSLTRSSECPRRRLGDGYLRRKQRDCWPVEMRSTANCTRSRCE